MPEGDTIHRAARTLHRALAGKQVTRFTSVFPALNRVDEDTPLAGQHIDRVEAHGKHLLFLFSSGLGLRTHMRMSGSWHIYRPGEPWQRPRAQMRIALETADMHAIAFLVHDAQWLHPRELQRSVLGRLGPDVLDPGFDASAAVERLRAGGERPLLDVLLDQRVLAGFGNVYKSELLFLAGVHPCAPAGGVPRATLAHLVELGAELLRANAAEGAAAGIVTHGLRRTTSRHDPDARLWVYGRAGQPCRRCATPIECARLGQHARVTFFCPTCQPQP